MRLLVIFSILALTLRFLLIFSAYHGDLNNNISWGKLAIERGLSGFYEGEEWPYSAPNQPPLTILMFSSLMFISEKIEVWAWWLNNSVGVFPSKFIWFWEVRGETLMVKLPSIFADIILAWMMYFYILRKKKERLALLVAGVWFFNPVTWYNSAIWGQTDNVVNLLGLAGIFFLLEKKLVWFSFFFTLSLLFKGSLAIFIPVLAFVVIYQKHKFPDVFKSALTIVATVFVTSVWFRPKLDLYWWLVELYRDRILPGEIGYLTANAFNFWWLVNSGEVPDSALYFGISARIWGFAILISVISILIVWLMRKYSEKRFLIVLSLTALATFLFMTRIHERYMYPFFPPATLLLPLLPSIWLPYLVLTFTHFLNLYHLFWAPSFGPLEALYDQINLGGILSFINLGVFFYFLRQLRTSKI